MIVVWCPKHSKVLTRENHWEHVKRLYVELKVKKEGWQLEERECDGCERVKNYMRKEYPHAEHGSMVSNTWQNGSDGRRG